MSEGFENTEEVLADEQIGETSVEAAAADDAVAEDEPKQKAPAMSIYDIMLLLSLVFVTVATLLMFRELFQFGDLSGFPWRTAEFQVE
ncbi:MAG: hypothetical protein AAF456_07985 [Planctomycetota bacterium]